MNWDEFINYELLTIGDVKIIVGNLIFAVIIAVATWIFVKMLRRTIVRPNFIADKINQKRRMSIFLITKYIIWVISLLLMLEVIGLRITVFLVGSTALVVVLGLGLQNIFKDLISGLFLLFEGTIKIGDIIEADGIIGRVVEINLRNSHIMTRDDVTMVLPNSKFIMESIVNWSHNNDSVRFIVNVGVAYGSDVEAVMVILKQAMDENESIPKKPVPFVRFKEFGESALLFEMIFWSNETFIIENVKSDLRRAVYRKLNENNVVIPFPQRDLHIRDYNNLLGKNTGTDLKSDLPENN